jgi:hypothetical protein
VIAATTCRFTLNCRTLLPYAVTGNLPVCKNGPIAFSPLIHVLLKDKGDKAGVHPYNRFLARA